MTKIVQIEVAVTKPAPVTPGVTPAAGAGGQPEDVVTIYALSEDGKISICNVSEGIWTDLPTPEDDRVTVFIEDSRMPKGYKLMQNPLSKLWAWRKGHGTSEEETGDVFEESEDAIKDAKQRHLLENIKESTL